MSRGQKPSIRFNVDDNSGAKEAEFVGIPGNSKVRRNVKVGDIIKITVKKALPNGTIKPGQMFFALITRTREKIMRKDGTEAIADANGIVLLDNKKAAMIGTRVLAVVAREIMNTYPAIASLAEEIY